MASRSVIWSALLVAAWLGSSVDAHAGYAQASPPPGWSSAGFKPSGAATAVVRSASNDWAYWTKANISVAGRSIAVDAALKPAANAARFVAKRGFLLGPGIAPMLAAWAISAGLEYWWDEAGQKWMQPEGDAATSDGYEYCVSGGVNVTQACSAGSLVFGTVGEAVQELMVRCVNLFDASRCRVASNEAGVEYLFNSSWRLRLPAKRSGDCPAGWFVTDAGCVQTPPPKDVGAQEFEDALAPHPDKMPDDLIKHFPEPIPMTHPSINPKPDQFGQPWPFDVPVGDPKPNPNFDPETEVGPDNAPYTQPMVRITPRPTEAEPWRVEQTPWERPQESAEPSEVPRVDAPTGDGGGPVPPGSAVPGQPGLCDQFPGILACVDLGEAEEAELDEKEQPFEFEEVGGFAGGNTCPPPISVEVVGHEIEFSWEPFCDSLTMIRPLMIAMAWLSAAFILLGARET